MPFLFGINYSLSTLFLLVSIVFMGPKNRFQMQIAELSKREVRLKDVFQKQVASFREAVYSLFGYRVDMATEAQGAGAAKSGSATFVLRPQFADSSRMQLMFCLHKGQMELLPTDFTERKLKREVETFIDRCISGQLVQATESLRAKVCSCLVALLCAAERMGMTFKLGWMQVQVYTSLYGQLDDGAFPKAEHVELSLNSLEDVDEEGRGKQSLQVAEACDAFQTVAYL